MNPKTITNSHSHPLTTLQKYPKNWNFSPSCSYSCFTKFTGKTSLKNTDPDQSSSYLHLQRPKYFFPLTFLPPKGNFENILKIEISPHRSHSFFTKFNFQNFSLKHPQTPKLFIASPPEPQILSLTHIPTTLRPLWIYPKNWKFSPRRSHSFFTKCTFKNLGHIGCWQCWQPFAHKWVLIWMLYNSQSYSSVQQNT